MPLDEIPICWEEKRTELDAHSGGRPPSKDMPLRRYYHVIRICHVDDGVTAINFFDQKD